MNHLIRRLSVAVASALALGGCGAGVTATPTVATTSPAAATSAPDTAVLSEWSVATPTTITTGKHTFAIQNSGGIPHELLVFKSALDVSKYPVDATGDIVEDGAGITLLSDGENVDPAGSQSRVIEFTTPGTYVFVCNIPGHFKHGMFAVVTVS